MNQAQLIKAVIANTGLSRRKAEAAVTAMLDTIVRTVTAGEDVSITNFGTFRACEDPAQIRRNPQTGSTFQARPMARMRFRVSPKAQQIVAAGDTAARRRKEPKRRHAA